ncbi:hypothetical protein GCM10011575_09670 [Microlunatus endophyticus]|uniref:Lipoprotein n=1 Tax=Microlunatus endophyticus TaxID=1716077 RepID=A0A917W216_9ACTN|nr:hypothetical protein [Microlunatus endophyticus]GGL53329.1 hypothetical protein GCM10011575_09670 [Microlunatus endophyticus]
MRHKLALALILPILMACGANSVAGQDTLSGASCVGPYLDDQPRVGGRFGASSPTVHPGDSITVYGHWYAKSCNDSGGHDPIQPLPSVRLTLTLPDGRVQHLDRYTPTGPDFGFAATVRIPPKTAAGTAVVRDDRDPVRATFTFTIGSA